MGYEWVTEWNGYNLSYGTGSADAFHSEPNRSFTYSGNTPLTGNVTIGENKTWIISEGNRIEFAFGSSSSWSSGAYYNGNYIAGVAFSGSGYNRTDLLMMVDETNERCAIYEICYRANDGLSFIFPMANNSTTEHNAYLLYQLGNVPPVTYTWESVQSISGKLGMVNLARIKDDYINDGEPVSGAAKSRFSNLKDGNKVSVLIENVLPDPAATGTDVTIKYDIPSLSSGSYTYCKLVAKKNSMPESVTDGSKIIDLDPTKASVTVKYLSGNTKYYFEIFTQDSEGHEAVSNVKSITTGEAHDIILFTDEFNTSILKSGWALDVYKSMFSNASTEWAPTSFTSDFLSSYNFLCGNGSRRQLSMSNGELWTANETGMTDQTFWIPIERTYINESIVVSFDGKISPIGWSSSYYNYIQVWLAYVDDNNTWHSYNACGDIVTDQQWHNFEHEVQAQFPYIDYIGLCCCDGSSHWKNIKVINV